MADSNSSTWREPQNWTSRPVCVLGGGVLGRRIAACFYAAGYNVHIRDPSAESRTAAEKYVKDNVKIYTTLTRLEAGKLEVFEEFDAAVKDCWMVVEAVPEVLKIKTQTFAELERAAPGDCILATNSSSFKSGELLTEVKEETKMRVLNTHFMMPPEALIVELMTSGSTNPAIFPFVEARMKQAGLHPITALKESTGFVFNRVWAAIKREVLQILAEGVSTPETIDAMWIEQYASRKVGPCMMMDQVGLDTVEHIEGHYISERKLPDYHLNFLKENYISQGKLGLKSDKGGFYPPPEPNTQTKLYLLDLGMARPVNEIVKDPNGGKVMSLTLESPDPRPTTLVNGLAGPDGIDVLHDRIYWTNMGNPKENDGSIQSANLDGSDVKYVLKPGDVHTPKQLTIDQESGTLYFCDREGLKVMRCQPDGSKLEILYASGDWASEPEKKANGVYWPVGITLSKKLNKFFWTQKGHSKAGEGRIFSAPLTLPSDPFNRNDIEIIASNLPECIDLEFDDDTGYLYWTDRGEVPFGNTLNRKQILGSPSDAEKPLGREILAQGLGEGIGLRLDKERKCLYVSDIGGHLWKVPVDGGVKEKIYEGDAHSFTGVAFFRY